MTATLKQVLVGQLHPATDNPRTDVGDVDEMATTMKQLGVLEPLVVSKNGASGYTVVAGHRRLAAAKQAGLKTVPCVVHEDLSDQARAEMMLVENLQRTDLTPIEEAKAYRRLTELGRSQRDLAKVVGRSQSHISKRVALLKLPEVALAAVDSGGITLETAISASQLPAERLAELFKGGKVPSVYTIRQAVIEWEADQEKAKLLKELADRGVTVMDKQPGPAHKHRLDGPDGYGIRLTAEQHQGEPCHVAVLGWGSRVEYFCTDPARHDPDGDSALKIPEPEPATAAKASMTSGRSATAARKETPEQKAAREVDEERRAEAQVVQADRYEFVRALVSKPAQAANVMGFVAKMTVLSGEPFTAKAMVLLDVKPGEDMWDPQPLVDYIDAPTGGPPWAAMQVLYALALAFGLDQVHITTNAHWPVAPWEDGDLQIARIFFDHLVAQGYELAPIERWLLGEDQGEDV